MHPCSDLIQRIVSRSGVSGAARYELERELYAHIEDAMEDLRSQGFDDTVLLQLVRDRFGEPDQIAHEFETAHRFKRSVVAIGRSVSLMGISLAVVATFILAFQLVLALVSGTMPSKAFPHLREEFIGFGSLTLGYMGFFVQERLFTTHKLIKAAVLNTILFAVLFRLASAGLHVNTFAPVVAFVSAMGVRALQHTVLRSAWFLATAIPIAAALLSAGSLLSANAGSSLWLTVLIRWTGLTTACYFLTLLSRNLGYTFLGSESPKN